MAQIIGGTSQTVLMIIGETSVTKGKAVEGETLEKDNGNHNTDRNRFKKVEMPIFTSLELES